MEMEKRRMELNVKKQRQKLNEAAFLQAVSKVCSELESYFSGALLYFSKYLLLFSHLFSFWKRAVYSYVLLNFYHRDSFSVHIWVPNVFDILQIENVNGSGSNNDGDGCDELVTGDGNNESDTDDIDHDSIVMCEVGNNVIFSLLELILYLCALSCFSLGFFIPRDPLSKQISIDCDLYYFVGHKSS